MTDLHGESTGNATDLADGAPMRSDARRNLALVLAAALDLFAEEGETVSMEAIAHRAGVGIGTIYRRFPTKAALAEAVLVDQLTAAAAHIAHIAETETDSVAFFEALDHIVSMSSTHRNLKQTLASVIGHELDKFAGPIFEGIRTILADLLERAQSVGAIRADVSIDDTLGLCFAACAAGEHEGGPTPERLFSLITDGLRAQVSTPT